MWNISLKKEKKLNVRTAEIVETETSERNWEKKEFQKTLRKDNITAISIEILKRETHKEKQGISFKFNK